MNIFAKIYPKIKLMNHKIILIALAAILAFTVGCVKKQSIIGRWLLVDAQNPQIDSMFISLRQNIHNLEDTLTKMNNGEAKTLLEGQLAENKTILTGAEERLKEFKTNSYMNYRDDGTYEGMMMGQTESGTYTYDENKKIINGKVAGAKEGGELKVLRVNADTLIVAVEPENIKLTFVADKK